MDKNVLVSDVSINTLVVEVKVMKIGSRQVTQSVFKQLPAYRIVHTSTLGILGNPWGWVNYHARDMCDEVWEHIHVIFERDGKLCRSTVYENPLHLGSPYGKESDKLVGLDRDNYIKEYNRLYKQLEQLDQLFIAV